MARIVMLLKMNKYIFSISIHKVIRQLKHNCSRGRDFWDMVTFILTTAISKKWRK